MEKKKNRMRRRYNYEVGEKKAVTIFGVPVSPGRAYLGPGLL